METGTVKAKVPRKRKEEEEMKKLLAILLVMALGLIGAAFAEETEGRTINCGIEDGVYVIRLTLNEGEDGWKADDMAQDDSIVAVERLVNLLCVLFGIREQLINCRGDGA